MAAESPIIRVAPSGHELRYPLTEAGKVLGITPDGFVRPSSRDPSATTTFRAPKYACYTNIAYQPLDPIAVNVAACSFADFDGATAANFIAGRKVIFQSGPNVGLWIVNANLTSLSPDLSSAVEKGKLARPAYSAGAPQYMQTGDTSFAFELQAQPLGDWADLQALMNADALAGRVQRYVLTRTDRPYIAEQTLDIPPELSFGSLDRAGCTIVGTMQPITGTPLPAIFHGGPLGVPAGAICRAMATGSPYAGQLGRRTLTVEAAPAIVAGDDIVVSFDFIAGEVNSLAQWYRVLSVTVNADDSSLRDLHLNRPLVTNYPVANNQAHVATGVLLFGFKVYDSVGSGKISGTCARVYSLGGTIACDFQLGRIDDSHGFGWACQIGSFDVGGCFNQAEFDFDVQDGSDHQANYEAQYLSRVEGKLWLGGSLLDSGTLLCSAAIESIQPAAAAYAYTVICNEGDSESFTFDNMSWTGGQGFYSPQPLGRTGTPIRMPTFVQLSLRGYTATGLALAGQTIPGIVIAGVTLTPAQGATGTAGINIDGNGSTATISRLRANSADGLWSSNVAIQVGAGSEVFADDLIVLNQRAYTNAGRFTATHCLFDWHLSPTLFDTGCNTAAGAAVTKLSKARNICPPTNSFALTVNAGSVVILEEYESVGSDNEFVGAGLMKVGHGCTFGATGTGYGWAVNLYQMTQPGGAVPIVTTGGAVPLSISQQYTTSLETSGALASDATLTFLPWVGNIYAVHNANTGAHNVVCKTNVDAGAGVTIPPNATAWVRINSANNAESIP